MKSSFALTTLLFLPDALAIAVPHIPKLVSKRFGSPADVPRGESAHQKRDTHLELRQPRGRPLVVAGGPTTSSTGTTSAGGTYSTGDPGHLPPDPQQQAHNSIVGGHPFYGHGPVVNVHNLQNNTDGAMNLTVVVPVGTNTVPPIQNATATAYEQPVITSCMPSPVPEYIDSNGNFLPGDQQPGYNGSVSTNGTVPGNCPGNANASPVPIEEIVIEGHVDGDIEIVDIDIIPLNGTNSTDPTSTSTSGTVSSVQPPASSGGSRTGTRQRVPAVPVGFTGP